MTAIFPSENRIREIVYQRIQQLYESSTLLDNQLPSSDSNVTNIYERILIDLCTQCFAELPNNSTQCYPNVPVDQIKQPLAFYNPPNRLECIQQHILKRVQKLLRNGGNATTTNASTGKTTHPLSGGGRLVSSKRKRDLVDEILVQEMLEDDALWTNFDVERIEVLRNVSNDILRMMIEEAVGDCKQRYEDKLRNAREMTK